jgi:hypothetical protein
MLKPREMAGRDERLTPATRNYVMFGLLFVIALGLAIRDWVDPRERRGAPDSPLRLLIVSTDEHGPFKTLRDLDGFNVTQIEPGPAISIGRSLLDEDVPAHRAAIAYADEQGFGFVALDLFNNAGHWEIDDIVPATARYAVFSVGDVAVEGPRMRAIGLPEHIEFDPLLAKLDSLRLALFEHPDLLRLWTIEPNVTEGQAHQVFDSRNFAERAEMMKRSHADWSEFLGSWPKPERIPGSLAGPWERVQAAPIPGGLLLEIRPVQIHADLNRKLRLEHGAQATLAFLPQAGVGDQNPADREPCSGLPEQPEGAVAVAPDGSAVALDGSSGPRVFVFEPGTQCRVREFGVHDFGDHWLGRPSANGAIAWNYEDDWLHWWDAFGEHRVRVEGSDADSGPWWVDDDLLALLGERAFELPEPDEESFSGFGYEPVIVLLATTPDDDDERARVELGIRELFPNTEPDAEPPAFRHVRPAGPRELLFTTEPYLGADDNDEWPRLHRLRAAAPLSATVRELASGAKTSADVLTVETLGSLVPHYELAAAADGSRIAWIDRATQSLWVADLRGPNRMNPRRLDLEPTPDSSVRISADGRTIVSEVEIEFVLHEKVVDSVLIPRAFVLEPAPE